MVKTKTKTKTKKFTTNKVWTIVAVLFFITLLILTVVNLSETKKLKSDHTDAHSNTHSNKNKKGTCLVKKKKNQKHVKKKLRKC